MNQKLGFLCFWGIHNSLSSFWAKLGYSWIKIDHFVDSLLKLQIKAGVHLINVELTQLLTLVARYKSFWLHRIMKIITTLIALGFVNYSQACFPYLTNIHNRFHNMVAARLVAAPPTGGSMLQFLANNF